MNSNNEQNQIKSQNQTTSNQQINLVNCQITYTPISQSEQMGLRRDKRNFFCSGKSSKLTALVKRVKLVKEKKFKLSNKFKHKSNLNSNNLNICSNNYRINREKLLQFYKPSSDLSNLVFYNKSKAKNFIKYTSFHRKSIRKRVDIFFKLNPVRRFFFKLF